MTLKKWLALFLGSAVLAALLFGGFNAAVDPFGVFGDRFIGWWSYNMTQNPRTAKIGWLDVHHAEYDSYIIGSSKTSSFPTELLNQYTGGRFYNLFSYGGDLYDAEMTVNYVLENYDAKRIIVNVGIPELMAFNVEDDPIKGNLHAKVDGSSLLAFYGKYLFAHPQYAVDKLRALPDFTDWVNPNQVFVPATGTYDKRARDIEPIGDLGEYLALYPAFEQTQKGHDSLPAVEACLASIGRIRAACEAAGVEFTLVISPMYQHDLARYDNEDLARFLEGVGEAWDFSGYHSVSGEPRYFYDIAHHRNAVGAMMLARIFGDDSIYVPEDFGVFIDDGEVRMADFKAQSADYHAGMLDFPPSEAQLVVLASDEPEAVASALRKAGLAVVEYQAVMAYGAMGADMPRMAVLMLGTDSVVAEGAVEGDGVNVIVRALPQSALGLEVYTVPTGQTPAEVAEYVKGLNGYD